ncbi:MAG TPA: hypothetical protein VMI31_07670 [Fimbriimonadaceae bacterium]|nr:hypothetical protein [Fimbriimonadaceae bacterium]
MLPLLPALILLILQGPASFERTAWNGQSAAWLDGLHRQTEAKSRAADATLASLLSGSHRSVAQALARLLSLTQGEGPKTPASTPESAEEKALAPAPAAIGSPAEGFYACRRSRDGPSGLR